VKSFFIGVFVLCVSYGAEAQDNLSSYKLAPRGEAFADAAGKLKTGDKQGHSGRIGDALYPSLWNYWRAVSGEDPETWKFEPMPFSAAPSPRFTVQLQDVNGTPTPVYPIAGDKCFLVATWNKGVQTLGFSVRNPYDEPAFVKISGKLRVYKKQYGFDMLVFCHDENGKVRLIRSTLQPESIINDDGGEYLQFADEFVLPRGKEIFFIGKGSVTEDMKSSSYYFIQDDDGRGKLFRPSISMMPLSRKEK
jgi:hypothetical protein